MKIFDLVTRSSYNNDIVFQIIDIKDKNYILKGINYRLIADSYENDLLPFNDTINLPLPYLKILDHATSGKVLHIDGDEIYVKKAQEAYNKYHINAKCIYMKEELMPNNVVNILKQDKYDILVITGHDFYKFDTKQASDDLTRYQNSINFVSAVQQVRLLYPDLDSLVIVAGACQSNYEALMEYGANFASSPNRENIHLLDPIIIASIVALTPIKDYINPKAAIDKTISKSIGGIETKGKARIFYSGVQNEHLS